jgi:glutamate carboxypeptidase
MLHAMTLGEQRICGLIEGRRAALLEDLRLHVGLPTGGNNRAALDESRELLTARLRKLGAAVELIAGDPKPDWLHGLPADGYVPPTAVCRRTGRGPQVLICGHLDTVHDPRGDFRALAVAADGRTATGPGCVDMKGGLVIVVAALEALDEAGVGGAWTVLLNSDEETGSYHSERAIRAESARHDIGLAVEPALPGGELAVERLGAGQFMIETFGRSAHAGRDFEKGVSAVTALAECVVKVASMSDPARGLIANIGPLEGGSTTNVVPDHARAWGNVRFADSGSAEELARRLHALATAGDALPRVVVKTSFIRAAKPLIEPTRRLAEFARSAAEDLGQRLPFGKTGGVCDGNIMQDAGLPTIDTLGVRGGGLHTPQEWIELASLVERCQLLAVMLARVAAGGFDPRERKP